MKTKGFLGVDVSKGYADFVLPDEQKQVLEEGFLLEDTPEGRKQLKDLIKQWFSKGMQELYCGVESTGGYENNWYSFLRNIGLESKVHVARLNPKGVKAISNASLKRTITDAVSAENIAVYLISFPQKAVYVKTELENPEERYKDGRQHYSFIRMQQKQKVQAGNQLEKLLYQHFSEMLVYCRHGVPGWLLRMLSKYSCATAVVKAGAAKLSAIKGISADKAEALLQKAKQSTQIVSVQVQHTISLTARQVLYNEDIIQQEKAHLTKIFEQDENVQLLASINGVGVPSAVAFVLEIEDVARFESAKKLAAYFGVHPQFKQSGDGTWGSHMSKQGRSEIRAGLYMAALTAIRCNPILKKLYASCRARGMKHYQAMGVLMHKLLRIIYGVLKNKTKFDKARDEKNQTQAADKQKQSEEQKKEATKNIKNKKYRYQPNSDGAPISRRAAKKRKEQIAS